jgi:hypothetical protein
MPPQNPFTCPGSYEEVGPYNQTLFLGCSLTNFNMNLGWGADASSITISLVSDPAYHPASNKYGPLNTLVASTNANTNRTSTALRRNADGSFSDTDAGRNLFKTISPEIAYENQYNDLGKVYWDTNNNLKKYWTDPDPGFLGLAKHQPDGTLVRDAYDIIGAPAFFKFSAGISFGGMISDWKSNGGAGGSGLFEVTLKSYASLLAGSYLIIDDYVGSISTSINDDIAVPSNTTGVYTSDIVKGNMPNVFNIFGYLEDKGFGYAGKTDGGVSALQIYYALQDLAGGISNPFSPYGAIIAKHPLTMDGDAVDVSSQEISSSNTAGHQKMTLKECGLCPNILATDGVRRTQLKLDLSELPIPPNDLFLNSGPTISILDFISRICNGSGFDFYVDFRLPDNDHPGEVGNFSGVIVIRTVSKRNQPPREIIKKIVANLVGAGAKVSSYNYGQEYNDKEVRAMYIGSKQQRLLQVKSVHISSKQTSLVFDPYHNNGAGHFIDLGGNTSAGTNYENYFRIPDAGSTRYTQTSTDGGSAVGQINDWDVFETLDTFGTSLNIYRGNYFPTEEQLASSRYRGNPNPVFANNESYPLYNDLISPYFGYHGQDSAATETPSAIDWNEPRKVYLDRKTGQLQIVFRNNDITALLTKSFVSNGEFVVLENELRAAGGGFEAWFSYCFDNIFDTDIADLIYSAFCSQYTGFGNRRNFLAGLNIINWDAVNKSPVTQTKETRAYTISIENAQPYVQSLYADLKKVHEFFANICNTYYAKKYMVKTPKIRWYQTSPFKNSEGVTTINYGNFAYSSSSRFFTDWEIATDGAWEEEGNFIDDTIVVGSIQSALFSDDKNRIQTILGFNANGDFASRDFWSQTYLANKSNPNSLTALMLARSQPFASAVDRGAYFYFPLDHSMSPENYLYVPYKNPTLSNLGLEGFTNTLVGATLSPTTPHGEPIPSEWQYKMYVKSEVESKVIFLQDVDDYYRPRAIVSLPDPLYLGGGKSDAQDSLSYVQLHDALIKINKGSAQPPNNVSRTNNSLKATSNPMNWKAILLAWGFSSTMKLIGGNHGISINNSAENVTIVKKATCPEFAAIPIKFNRANYGPWINHPGLNGVSSLIFIPPEADKPYSQSSLNNLVNNLVGGVKVNVDDNLNPWTYGGTNALDASVMSIIKDDINYQQVTEQGSIGAVGLLLNDPAGNPYSIGSVLKLTAEDTAGPVVTNFNVSLGNAGITSTYNMRTYVKKIGFFNKENSDRIRDTNLEFIKRRRDTNNSINNALNKMKPNTFAATTNGLLGGDTPKPLRWSPFEILAGAAYPQLNHKSSIEDIYNDLGFSPSWSKSPYSKDTEYNTKDMLRYLTNVSLQDIQELPREFKDDYAQKSFMSLDGLLSPISFYPTLYGSTYNITKYPRERCAFCSGVGKYSWEKFDIPKDTGSQPISFSALVSLKVTETGICPFCEVSGEKTKRAYKSASPKQSNPPYILASGDDLTILSNNANTGLPSGETNRNTIINYSTLNPILLATGEFSCAQNRQSGDLTGHSIDLLGLGMTVPETGNSLKFAYSSTIEKNFLDYDQNYIDHCVAKSIPTGSGAPANNARFFGLRGPLMVHAWGYDLEGFPVPNSSGEFKLDTNGEIVKDSSGNIIYKNQTQKPDLTWTEPYKEASFYKGWGQLPGTWPVGPIDLRWDEVAGVWVAGGNAYKPVWVVIETDLVNDQPSRGEIVDDSYNNRPLASGLRKLVFVKDSLGINAAPRGAHIYCNYNSQNGFYEPIYNRTSMTSGIVRGANSVDMYNMYQNTTGTYLTTYSNPLDFNTNVGDVGLFTFIGSGWILQSYRC